MVELLLISFRETIFKSGCFVGSDNALILIFCEFEMNLEKCSKK